MNITAYDDHFDDENENGYHGDVYAEPSRPGEVGAWFGRNSLSNNLINAFEHLRAHNLPLDTFTLCYRTPEGSFFRRIGPAK